MAIVIHDQYQGRGLGTELFQHLVWIAREKGVKGVTAQVLAQNDRMLKLFRKTGREVRSSLENGVYNLSFRLED
ncbi:MAG: GNAT family N-acetyltransferase, partial [Candidatus Neomarinimicrobiota bacterium]